ncbi:MAG: histidinol-phosphate transaminase [Epulopiscium sp. Nele67-Bin004]|nr:MAG: histidinol-phosphate transaminase [Epulopiscium sp. Nele67-Bin004]
MSRFFTLKNLVPYTPGEQPSLNDYIKLNTNENPYPPSKNVRNVLNGGNLHLYPDPKCSKLTKAFSDYYNIDKEEVIFANGSDEILAFCYFAFCKDKVAFPSISYGFYEVYANLFELESNKIPLLSNFKINPANYLRLNQTIIIANPNAPTGIALSVSDIEIILEHNPNNIVIIDEAYSDFGEVTCRQLINKYDNLVVVGTFSKSRNLAGARLGYAIANKEVISDLQVVRNSFNPYNVNTLTQALGVASIEDDEYFKSCTQKIVEERQRFITNLDKLGYMTLESGANFVFTKHKSLSGEQLYTELRSNKILVRYFDKIKDYVRITIGTPEQMAYVIKVMEGLN